MAKTTSGPVLFNWHVGTLQRYSSLWLILQRIFLLNSVVRADIRAIGSGIGLGMKSLVDNHGAINLETLASSIGEKPTGLRFSTLQPFAPWTHRYFLTTSIRYCPYCLRDGFHTVFFCLTLMKRCPIHDVDLLMRCNCGQPISATLNSKSYMAPGACDRCLRTFLLLPLARRPLLAEESLDAFNDLAKWMTELSARIYTMIGGEPEFGRSEMKWEATAELASQLLRIPYPTGLAKEPVPVTAESVHRDGHTFGSLRQVAEAWTASWDVFRAVDRYLRRHVLRGQKWTSQLAMSEDADRIGELIRSEPNAFIAWVYLLWLMVIFRTIKLRDLRSRAARDAYSKGLYIPGRVAIKHLSEPEPTVWMQYHATETSLLALWRAVHRAALAMAQGHAPVRWGRGLVDTRECFRWVGVVHSSGTVEFEAMQSAGLNFGHAARPHKLEARKPMEYESDSSFPALANLPKRGLLKTREGDWKAGTLTSPRGSGMYKVHRLLHAGDDLHFIVMEKRGRNRHFASRLVEFGIEARGQRPRDAINALREAVRQYTKNYGTPWSGSISKHGKRQLATPDRMSASSEPKRLPGAHA